MYKTIFNMGTVTNAMRAKSLLDRYGYSCAVNRTAERAKREGCGYSVQFYGDAAQAEAILRQSGLKIRSVQRADGI